MTDRTPLEPAASGHLETATPELPAEDLCRFFDLSPIGTAVIDQTRTIVYVNERATEIHDAPADELCGNYFIPPEMDIYYEDGTPVPAEAHPVNRVFETGKPVYGYKHRLENSSGADRWFSGNVSPVSGKDGEIEYVVVCFEDITDLKRRTKRLTSDQVRLVEFRTDESAVPSSLHTETGEIRIEIESVVSVSDGTTVQYMRTDDLPAAAFVAAVEEVPHIVDVRLLSTIDGITRIEAKGQSPTASDGDNPGTVSEVFAALGGCPRAIVVTNDEVRFLGELPGDVDPQIATQGIAQFHSGTSLCSEQLAYSPHLLYDIVSDALTDRQFAALEAAYYGGYFETPRASTGDELAERFDVTRQTFNQHLRKAQQTVFRHLFEKSGADEH